MAQISPSTALGSYLLPTTHPGISFITAVAFLGYRPRDGDGRTASSDGWETIRLLLSIPRWVSYWYLEGIEATSTTQVVSSCVMWMSCFVLINKLRRKETGLRRHVRSEFHFQMAPEASKKLEDEVEKYRQTQNGKLLLSTERWPSLNVSIRRCCFVLNRHEEIR